MIRFYVLRTVYELDFNEPDLSTGIYSLVISAIPLEKVKVPLLGNTAIPLEVKVSASSVNIVNFKVGTTDNDQQTGPSLQTYEYTIFILLLCVSYFNLLYF